MFQRSDKPHYRNIMLYTKPQFFPQITTLISQKEQIIERNFSVGSLLFIRCLQGCDLKPQIVSLCKRSVLGSNSLFESQSPSDDNRLETKNLNIENLIKRVYCRFSNRVSFNSPKQKSDFFTQCSTLQCKLGY